MTNNTITPIKEIGFTFISKKDLNNNDCNSGDELKITEFDATENMYVLDNLSMSGQWIRLNEKDLLEVLFATKEEAHQFQLDRIDGLITNRKIVSKYLTSEKEKIEQQLHSVDNEILELYKQKEPYIYNGKTKDEYFQSIAGKVFEENDYTITLGTPLFDQIRITTTRDLFIEMVTGQYHETEGKLTVQNIKSPSRPSSYTAMRVPLARRERYDEMNKLLVKYGELVLLGKL
ncbi:hypothetical protein [Bacillus bombysepticus]|uniref:hypothetical protein n=1 Tax=Bacillus bombysepticus TaxID=658666 RepID=UPI003019A53B